MNTFESPSANRGVLDVRHTMQLRRPGYLAERRLDDLLGWAVDHPQFDRMRLAVNAGNLLLKRLELQIMWP